MKDFCLLQAYFQPEELGGLCKVGVGALQGSLSVSVRQVQRHLQRGDLESLALESWCGSGGGGGPVGGVGWG